MNRKQRVIIIPHFREVEKTEIILRPIRERELQRLTEAQVNAIPDLFRCYSCQDVFPKTDIGGIELDQRICKYCYPFLDEWTVGTIIKFDIQRKFYVEGD
jgi:hypothetical protein